MKFISFISVLLAIGVYSAKLPEYLKKCKKGTDNGDCVAVNEQAVVDALLKNSGEPKFKLQGLTPIHVSRIDLQATPQLKVGLSEVDFFGFEHLKPTGGNIDADTLHIKSFLPHVEIIGKYDINGKILILPIQGQGNCNITLVDFDVDYIAKLVVEERKGKKYYQVAADDNTTLKINNIKKVHWQFNNLFNGDERLGPEMNRFLNENWKDVFSEVQVAIEQTAAYSIVNYFVNGYLHFIPIDELFEE
ncbi:protein takeout-like [Atheta coriaria]|uniref:protein takeout-like n=1 Tax=Dalotia coriaria TaxID=877792 RepID=UPI0031F41B63